MFAAMSSISYAYTQPQPARIEKAISREKSRMENLKKVYGYFFEEILLRQPAEVARYRMVLVFT